MSGEFISLIVALMWTFTAIFAEIASKRMGTLVLNVWRMIITIVLLGALLWVFCGQPFPRYTTPQVWGWFLASGFMGFVFGDYCLFNAYVAMGSKYTQLFMTLASPFAAITAWVLMGERMSWLALLGMIITLTGISISILGKSETGKRRIKLPLRGVLLATGAGMGQGTGLVLSKLGMQAYTAVVPISETSAIELMPFSGTMIRAMMGLLGFGLVLISSRKVSAMSVAWKDGKASAAAMGAILLGPFFGVSLSLMAVNLTHAGVAQTLMALTPVLILWPSYFIFGTKVTLQEFLGAAIAVIGASLFFI